MKHCLKEEEGEWKYNGEHEHVRSTLSACMEISQWNILLLVYVKSKIKFKRTGNFRKRTMGQK
jgi:hypothetical protein